MSWRVTGSELGSLLGSKPHRDGEAREFPRHKLCSSDEQFLTLRIVIPEDSPQDADLVQAELHKTGFSFCARRVETRAD